MTHFDKNQYQIVISGVGGQGVLFVTRLLAEAAIGKNLNVYTSETHGMAQRGGTVISHLKVGDFSSPLIRPQEADGLISLKAEGVTQHGGYLKPNGWAVVNAKPQTHVDATDNLPMDLFPDVSLSQVDADILAQALNAPKSLNLVMLGFTLSQSRISQGGKSMLYCTRDDIVNVLKKRFKGKTELLDGAVKALDAGFTAAKRI